MRVVVPPRVVRRVVLAPAVVLLAALVLSATPLIALVLAFSVRFLPGRWRALRLGWFLLVYLLRESLGVVALGTLWILSGFGWRIRSPRFRRAHLWLMAWYLRGLRTAAARVMGLVVVTESPPDPSERPLLVFSRHAGAGDSLLLVDLLLNVHGRAPSIVLKDALQLDPCIDVVLHRLDSRFIGARRGDSDDAVAAIEDLAAGLAPDAALVLFPEGGNFTEGRRRRAIDRLERDGFTDAVAKAHELTYLLPPRPGGAFGAIDAAPDSDVVFVAHTGLEQLSGLGDLWRGLPMDRAVRLTTWTVPVEDVPVEHAARVDWLYEWWERIDTWIEGHRDPQRPARPALAPDPTPDPKPEPPDGPSR